MIDCILVTGCGGDIGLAIGRLLKKERIANKLIGCDARESNAGIIVFDEIHALPRADQPDYISALTSLIQKVGANILIPTSEFELHRFAIEGFPTALSGARLISANPKALSVGLDKYLTNQVLAESGIPMPWTELVKNEPSPRLPTIIKARSGSGSKTIQIARTPIDVNYFRHVRPEDIWQQYLPGDDHEYTCGLYRTTNGETRNIIFRRRLVGGMTGEGEVVENAEITEILNNVAKCLDLKGSINVQLRLTESGPMIFEINPRFSSTVYFRHLLGFQDLIWAIEELSGASSSYTPPTVGTRFFRMHDEVVLPPKAVIL